MVKNTFAFLATAALSAGVLVHCQTRKFGESGSTPERLITEQEDFADYGFTHGHTTGYFIGLKRREIALTLDDGPVPQTLALAKAIAAKGVPVTYFMIGKNAAARPDDVAAIANLKLPNGKPATIIANHSWSHIDARQRVVCIACDGPGYAIKQILDADKVIAPHIVKQNAPFLFRAPGGNFFRRSPDETGDLAEVNAVLSRYIGPFRWDVSGDADGCANNPSACLSAYISQTEARAQSEGVIVLAHDAVLPTHNWILKYIDTMKARGYTFVALDAYPDKLAQYGTVPKNEVGMTNVTFTVTAGKNGSSHFSVSVANAAHVELYIDGLSAPLFKESAAKLEADRVISTKGVRQFLIKGYDAQGKLIGRSVRFWNF